MLEKQYAKGEVVLVEYHNKIHSGPVVSLDVAGFTYYRVQLDTFDLICIELYMYSMNRLYKLLYL